MSAEPLKYQTRETAILSPVISMVSGSFILGIPRDCSLFRIFSVIGLLTAISVHFYDLRIFQNSQTLATCNVPHNTTGNGNFITFLKCQFVVHSRVWPGGISVKVYMTILCCQSTLAIERFIMRWGDMQISKERHKPLHTYKSVLSGRRGLSS